MTRAPLLLLLCGWAAADPAWKDPARGLELTLPEGFVVRSTDFTFGWPNTLCEFEGHDLKAVLVANSQAWTPQRFAEWRAEEWKKGARKVIRFEVKDCTGKRKGQWATSEFSIALDTEDRRAAHLWLCHGTACYEIAVWGHETRWKEISKFAYAAFDGLAYSPPLPAEAKDPTAMKSLTPPLFAGRLRGKSDLIQQGGCTAETESAVRAALHWLARHQSPQGTWSSEGFSERCAGETRCAGKGYDEHDAGVTGLALLAFLGAGFTQASDQAFEIAGKAVRIGEIVRSGLQWLIANQDQDGCLSSRKGAKSIYGHAIATLALAEAYGMTSEEALDAPLQKAIDFLLAAQNPYKAWRYSKLCGDNDTSVTGWCVTALACARAADLTVGKTCFEGAKGHLIEVTDERTGVVGYTARGTGKVTVQGKNEDWTGHQALTAVGMLCRMFIDGNPADPLLEAGAKILVADLPSSKRLNVDAYYWYYGTLALYQYDGPEGRFWKRWIDALKSAVLPLQRPASDGCLAGSWDPDLDRWGFEGGRVFTTAMNALTLETCYRYGRVLKK